MTVLFIVVDFFFIAIKHFLLLQNSIKKSHNFNFEKNGLKTILIVETITSNIHPRWKKCHTLVSNIVAPL